MDIQYIIFQDVFSSIYYAHLLGGEFSNCYGQGQTAADAIKSLQFVVNYWRNKRKNEKTT